jgi:hypothetical protein
MLANLLMLTLAIGTLLVPMVWITRPLRLVNPYSQCGRKLAWHPALTEATL